MRCARSRRGSPGSPTCSPTACADRRAPGSVALHREAELVRRLVADVVPDLLESMFVVGVDGGLVALPVEPREQAPLEVEARGGGLVVVAELVVRHLPARRDAQSELTLAVRVVPVDVERALDLDVLELAVTVELRGGVADPLHARLSALAPELAVQEQGRPVEVELAGRGIAKALLVVVLLVAGLLHRDGPRIERLALGLPVEVAGLAAGEVQVSADHLAAQRLDDVLAGLR